MSIEMEQAFNNDYAEVNEDLTPKSYVDAKFETQQEISTKENALIQVNKLVFLKNQPTKYKNLNKKLNKNKHQIMTTMMLGVLIKNWWKFKTNCFI